MQTSDFPCIAGDKVLAAPYLGSEQPHKSLFPKDISSNNTWMAKIDWWVDFVLRGRLAGSLWRPAKTSYPQLSHQFRWMTCQKRLPLTNLFKHPTWRDHALLQVGCFGGTSFFLASRGTFLHVSQHGVASFKTGNDAANYPIHLKILDLFSNVLITFLGYPLENHG